MQKTFQNKDLHFPLKVLGELWADLPVTQHCSRDGEQVASWFRSGGSAGAERRSGAAERHAAAQAA
jgi:hypothetical protein